MVAEAEVRDLDLGLREEEGRLRCRDPQQAKVLAEYTDALTEQCPVAQANDEQVVCTVDDTGTRLGPVAGLAERFAGLWRAFEHARAELPAPEDMVDALPAFRAATRRLGAELDVASMDIRGVRDEIPFSLETQWDDDGTLARTVLEVRPTLPIDGRWHQQWSGDAERGPMPEGLAPLVGEARALQVDPTSIRLVFVPCRDRLEPHVDRLEGMLAVRASVVGAWPRLPMKRRRHWLRVG